jgi:hypothetical protein
VRGDVYDAIFPAAQRIAVVCQATPLTFSVPLPNLLADICEGDYQSEAGAVVILDRANELNRTTELHNATLNDSEPQTGAS